MRYVIFNSLSARHLSVEELTKVLREFDPEPDLMFVDGPSLGDGKEFFAKLKKDDDIVISGGDGSLNKLANIIDFDKLPNKVYLHKAGNGNDFLRDINELKEDIIEITPYLKKLPVVSLDGGK